MGNAPYFDASDAVIEEAGVHVVAIHAHSVGEQTRILLLTRPFVACSVESADASKPISAATWRCCELNAYARQVHCTLHLESHTLPAACCISPGASCTPRAYKVQTSRNNGAPSCLVATCDVTRCSGKRCAPRRVCIVR